MFAAFVSRAVFIGLHSKEAKPRNLLTQTRLPRSASLVPTQEKTWENSKDYVSPRVIRSKFQVINYLPTWKVICAKSCSPNLWPPIIARADWIMGIKNSTGGPTHSENWFPQRCQPVETVTHFSTRYLLSTLALWPVCAKRQNSRQ